MPTEFLFLAAGAVTLIGAARKDGKWPANGAHAVLATVALTLVASAVNGTKVGPLMRAFGLLFLASAIYAAVHANIGVKPAGGKHTNTAGKQSSNAPFGTGGFGGSF